MTAEAPKTSRLACLLAGMFLFLYDVFQSSWAAIGINNYEKERRININLHQPSNYHFHNMVDFKSPIITYPPIQLRFVENSVAEYAGE